MARIRSIKPTFFEDTTIAELPIQTRYFYIGLWCFMDRNGACENDPKLLKKNIFPYDDSVTVQDVVKMLNELVKIKRLVERNHLNKRLLYCRTFLVHQLPHHKETPKYPLLNELIDCPEKPGADPVLAQGKPGVDPVVNGEWCIVNGYASNETNSFAELETVTNASLLKKLKPEMLATWIKTYPDKQWLKNELNRSALWLLANKAKAPKSRFDRFVNSWLDRAWERHRKILASAGLGMQNRAPIDIFSGGQK